MDLESVITIASVPGIGRITVKKIIDSFEDRDVFLNASEQSYSEIPGLERGRLIKLKHSLEQEPSSDVKEKIRLIKESGARILIYGEDSYPQQLLNMPDPPILLYVRGEIKDTDINAIAVVGTRHPTDYGIRAAELISSYLSINGITLVSGCASGIDAAVHKSAISLNARTIAVLGSPVNSVYPKTNTKLACNIVSCGALLSEIHPWESVRPENFPQRNRIISALTIASVVVEAPARSGALITAGLSADMGKDVFSVPGSIFSKKAKGSNKLIQEGAIPVLEPRDILENLKNIIEPLRLKKAQNDIIEKNVSKKGSLILETMNNRVLNPDQITSATGYKIHEVLEELSCLELKGLIEDAGGKKFKRRT